MPATPYSAKSLDLTHVASEQWQTLANWTKHNRVSVGSAGPVRFSPVFFPMLLMCPSKQSPKSNQVVSKHSQVCQTWLLRDTSTELVVSKETGKTWLIIDYKKKCIISKTYSFTYFYVFLRIFTHFYAFFCKDHFRFFLVSDWTDEIFFWYVCIPTGNHQSINGCSVISYVHNAVWQGAIYDRTYTWTAKRCFACSTKQNEWLVKLLSGFCRKANIFGIKCVHHT